MLQGKKILLGICGSIAAYKSTLLVRLLVKEGAEVKVILTASASSFITPLTLSTLSKNPVLSEFTKNESGEWHNHVELGIWADLFIIAPASANTLAKCAGGFCDNLLTAVYLSAKCPVVFAPAMDLDMYSHPSVENNISLLKKYGNTVLDAEYGELASGLIGKGRMPEPESILQFIKDHFQFKSRFKEKTILITAGPTFEAIDPVRFIGNRSSGKMGYAIAEAFAREGARVYLVTGPTHIPIPPGVISIQVESADQMEKECLNYFSQADITVLAAAVADFKVENISVTKIKKESDNIQLDLVKTSDIALKLSTLKTVNQIVVGFALETDNELENARIKLRKKNFDLIVLNTLKDKGAGFSVDTNKISILEKDNKLTKFELKSKKEVALDILDAIFKLNSK